MLVFAFAFVGLAGAVAAWLPSDFERAFAMTPLAIGLGLGLGIGLASGIGALIGGQLTVRYAKGSRTWGARYSAWVSWGVVVPLIGSFYVPHPMLAMGLLFVAFLVAPQARATAVAIIGVVGVVIGQGMGPLLVGVLSDMLHTGASKDVGGLRLSMTLVALINLLTGLFFWTLGRRIGRVDGDAPQAA